MEKLGCGVTLSHEVEHFAKSIIRECAGLPLGTITMARRMREVDDICEWRNTLENLKASKLGEYEFKRDVFQVLYISFRSLNDSKLQ